MARSTHSDAKTHISSKSALSALSGKTKREVSSVVNDSTMMSWNSLEFRPFTAQDVQRIRRLNDTTETGLIDPSTTGTLFVQLLSRAVSELSAEDDVSRLLLENPSHHFKRMIRKYRKKSYDKIQKRMFQLKSGNKFDDQHDDAVVTSMAGSDAWNSNQAEELLEMKIFAQFISDILASSLLCLRRLLYVVHVLGVCRKIRLGN
jgi:hypothetical protein